MNVIRIPSSKKCQSTTGISLPTWLQMHSKAKVFPPITRTTTKQQYRRTGIQPKPVPNLGDSSETGQSCRFPPVDVRVLVHAVFPVPGHHGGVGKESCWRRSPPCRLLPRKKKYPIATLSLRKLLHLFLALPGPRPFLPPPKLPRCLDVCWGSSGFQASQAAVIPMICFLMPL